MFVSQVFFFFFWKKKFEMLKKLLFFLSIAREEGLQNVIFYNLKKTGEKNAYGILVIT